MRNRLEEFDEARGVLVDVWRRFQATGFGRLLMEHTPFVRDLADRGTGRWWLAFMPGLTVAFTLAFLPVLVLGPVWLRLLPVFLGMLAAWGVITGMWWMSYRDSVQRRRDALNTRPGLMDGAQARDMFGARATSMGARYVLPQTWAEHEARRSVSRVDPALTGILLGSCHRQDIYASVEIPGYVLGPARSGKSRNLVVPLIMRAPGPLVVTSTRKDVIDATMAKRRSGWHDGVHRRAGGTVWVFDPMNVSQGSYRHTLRWSPVAGCEDAHTARIHAAMLVGTTGLDGDNRVWQERGGLIVQSLLHAAALSGGTIEDVYRWSRSWTAAQEAARILERAAADPRWSRGVTDGSVAVDWADEINELKHEDMRMKSNKWFAVSQAFACLSEPRIRERLAVPPDDPRLFDMRRFLEGRDGRGGHDTVYFLCEFHDASGKGPAGVGGFVSMFLSDLLAEARRIAASRPYGRLEPYAMLVLDEIANIDPWPLLPNAVTAGSGDGIETWVFFQSRSQARAAYGELTEREMWESCQKWILGGVVDPMDLKAISDVTGLRRTSRVSRSWRPAGPVPDQTSESSEDRPVLEPAEIRELPDDMALLISGRHRPMIVNLLTDAKTQRTWERTPTGTAFRRSQEPWGDRDERPGTPHAYRPWDAAAGNGAGRNIMKGGRR